MSDTAKKIKKDGPQLENHAPTPGDGAPTTQENHASGGEVTTLENHAPRDGAK
ncbi:MAG TPA: sigma-like protein [Streptomyces sp.]|uniref:sigma-like protein n=1 Tax=Streptomyces sp. TaxID=1931 RepID=UPI002D731BDB|nr:sigma-like protein [Streptomyces sp.]HZG06968.1 sigma-like protein [Streptomyces sp.]